MASTEEIENLIGLLKIPSISTLPEHEPDMARCRAYLVQLFKSLGFKTKILPAAKHPAIFAQSPNAKLPTVLVYGHYDVQPPDPINQWTTPPFQPTVKNGFIYARGANDNKGQFMAHVIAAKQLAKHLPVNIKFLIEGEEEISSPSITDIAQKHRQLLAADYLVVSDSEMPAFNQPAIDISLRGLLYTEIRVATAQHDTHSGLFGGVIPNPAIILAHFISQLKDKNNHVLIPGFYDSVLAPTSTELEDFAKLEPTSAEILHESSAYYIGGGESDFSLNQRRWARPTLDVNGLLAGFTGEGSKTIIPATAMAKISMRLVPNQHPDAIFAQFAQFAKSLIPSGVKLEIIRHADCLPYKAPTTHPVFALAKDCLEKAFGKKPVFYATGGSIGAIPLLTQALGNIPCLMIGLGLPDNHLHAPNERFSLENFRLGIKALTYIYEHLPTIADTSIS